MAAGQDKEFRDIKRSVTYSDVILSGFDCIVT